MAPTAPSLFTTLPTPARRMNNPVFRNVAGVLVYRVRKNDGEPESPLTQYWFSLRNDNQAAVDVRLLAGYVEPEYQSQGNPQLSSQRWLGQLAAEAERVIRLALANDTFRGRPLDEA